MFSRLIRKDQFLRKQYKRFEIWNKLNKSLEKSFYLYNIPKPLKIKKNIYIVKHLYVIIVLRLVEVQEWYHFLRFLEC